MTPFVRVYSHVRSGTSYFVALLYQAFTGTIPMEEVWAGHHSDRFKMPMAGVEARYLAHKFYDDSLPGPRIHLVRDGRDVALSLWRTKGFQAEADRGLPFSQFLREPLDWHMTPAYTDSKGWTIAEHWRRHVDSWQGAKNTLLVRYEDLLRDQAGQLGRVAAFLGRELLGAYWILPGMGPEPSGDYRVRKWREAYSDDDLAYFHSIVPEEHWGLWHE